MNDTRRRSDDSGSVGKALEILRYFVDRQERWGVRELASTLGLPSSTAHRFLRSLARLGYLSFDRETRKYQVGMELFRIAAILGERLRIRDISMIPMNDLAGAIGQPVWLAVYDAAAPSMVVVAEAGGRQPMGRAAPLGARLPLATSAEGRALLAFLPRELQHAALAAAASSPDALAIEPSLREIQARGYAVHPSTTGELVVSAPVLDAQDRPIASLGSWTSHPLGSRPAPDSAAALCRAAQRISQALGSRLLGGGRAGTWHVGIQAIADLINHHVAGIGMTTESGAGDRNLDDLQRGIANYCLAVSASVDAAFEGRAPFRWPHARLAAMFSVFPLYLHIVGRPGLTARGLGDLAGLRISPADSGFTTAALFDRLMELAGFSAARLAKAGTRILHLDYAEANRQLHEGHLDVVLSLSGIPNPAYVEIARTLPISLVGIEDDVVARLVAREPSYAAGSIVGGTYPGIAASVATVQIPTVMTTVVDRPDDEVYEITRTLFERKSDLVRRAAAFEQFGSDFVLRGFRTPLHPGARRYWRERGLLDGDG